MHFSIENRTAVIIKEEAVTLCFWDVADSHLVDTVSLALMVAIATYCSSLTLPATYASGGKGS